MSSLLCEEDYQAVFFIGETGINAPYRTHGRIPKDKKVSGKISGKRYSVSMVAA